MYNVNGSQNEFVERVTRYLFIRPTKKNCYVALTRPKSENWVGRSIFFFFFFLRTVRELSFPIFFFKFLNGENSGGMQSKRIYKCFFKPLNTNFSKSFAQFWHFQQQKTKKQKKPDRFFAFYGRSGEGNITIFFWPYAHVQLGQNCPLRPNTVFAKARINYFAYASMN